MMSKDAPERLIRTREVVDRTSLSRSLLYEMVRRGTFPRPIGISSRRTAWPESEVSRWITENMTTFR